MATTIIENPSTVASSTPADTSAPVKVETSKSESQDKKEETNAWTYVFYGLVVLGIVLLAWYAYGRFVENSISEPFVEGQRQERGDPIMDFNLHEAIKDLERMQKKVLQRLSNDTGI